MLCDENGCAMCTSTPAVSKVVGLCKSGCFLLGMSFKVSEEERALHRRSLQRSEVKYILKLTELSGKLS